MKLFVLGLVTAVALLVVAGLVAIYSGVYNVAADKPHTAVETWILGTAMISSVKAHADAIVPPSDLGADRRIHDGFHLFDEMCVQCHGAPGKKPGEVGLGLRPEPPELSKVVTRWNTAQRFWIVRHGIIATGMPAFGGTHTDEQLWNIVAFLERLPDLTPEQYRVFEHGGGQPHEREHQHGH
jgi:mono/diheme cytochrome c family protein